MEEAPEGLAGVPVLDMEKILTAETKPDSRKRLAVYDLETAEPLKVVGLILSEALRENDSPGTFRPGQSGEPGSGSQRDRVADDRTGG